MKFPLCALAATAALTFPLPAQTKPPAREPDEIVRIWETGEWNGGLPGGWATDGEESSESTVHMGGTLSIGNVSRPELAWFAPEKAKAKDRAVIVFPGGGYNILAWDLEGTEVATWLSSLGYHAAVLKYRLPRKEDAVRHVPALQDAQRAIRLARHEAAARGISPERIGVMGFSAGGHLAAVASAPPDEASYPARDAIDAESCLPSFSILIYPAYLVDENGAFRAEALKVTGRTPPSFAVHAADDPVTPQSSTAWFHALRAERVPCELHLYPDGGHGYGMRSDLSVGEWPARLEGWLARLDK